VVYDLSRNAIDEASSTSPEEILITHMQEDILNVGLDPEHRAIRFVAHKREREREERETRYKRGLRPGEREDKRGEGR